MSDPWIDRLSEYVDGDMEASEREIVAAHLQECAECAATLADLRRVAGRARALTDRDPATDLWPGIAARIGASTPSAGSPVVPLSRRKGRRWSFTLPELIAAGVALTVLSGGGAVLLLRPHAGPVAVAPAPTQPSPLVPTNASERLRRGTYDDAVADLERVLAENRGRLDTATVRVIERNLAVIDTAIVQAQRALAADSGNAYLNSHLAATKRRKLEVLRQAANLVSAVS
jgi:anti-sigma factor RsiW